MKQLSGLDASFRDNMDVGLVGCAELLPDLHRLGDAIVDDLDLLAKAAGVGG